MVTLHTCHAVACIPRSGLKEKNLTQSTRKRFSILEILPDREVACATSDRRARISNSCVWGQCHSLTLTYSYVIIYHFSFTDCTVFSVSQKSFQ